MNEVLILEKKIIEFFLSVVEKELIEEYVKKF